MPPPVEDLSDEESGDIPFRDAPEEAPNADKEAEEEEEEEEEDNDEEDDGVYIVEKIVQHSWLDDGTLKLQVKWKGYEDPNDLTWEDEEGLMEGAGDIVNAYYKTTGGRPELPTQKQKSKPGRKRKSMGDSKSKTATPTPTPAAETKRRRKSTPKQTDTTKQEPTSSEENGAGWLPKGKNWDNEIEKVETIFKSNEGTLLACLEFINGKKATVEIPVCYEKCPLKMLKFYESHLVFKNENED